MKKIFSFTAVCMLVLSLPLLAQYQTNGSATTITPGTEYQLTPAGFFQAGSVFRTSPVSLSTSFTLQTQLYFGTISEVNTAGSPPFNSGGDGLAFVLQPSGPTALGGSGELIGYGGLANSFAAEFDTWQNENRLDPPRDHLSIQLRGDVNHYNADNPLGPVSLLNVEDGLWHDATFSWNALTQTFTVTLDGVTYPSLTYNVAAVTGNTVYLGFTAATGAAVNVHRVRFLSFADCSGYTVSIPDVPSVNPCGGPNTIYLGYGPQSVPLTAQSSSPAGTTFTWYMVNNPVPVGTGPSFNASQGGGYYVVATNGFCSASSQAKTVNVVDIRCGKEGQNKVTVCHKPNGNGAGQPNSLCISVNAVAAHLAHGDCLGECPGTSRMAAPALEVESPAVYPNPTHGQVQLQTATIEGRAQVEIINAKGTVVERKTVAGTGLLSLDLKKYGTGAFLIRIVSNGKVETHKVLVRE